MYKNHSWKPTTQTKIIKAWYANHRVTTVSNNEDVLIYKLPILQPRSSLLFQGIKQP